MKETKASQEDRGRGYLILKKRVKKDLSEVTFMQRPE